MTFVKYDALIAYMLIVTPRNVEPVVWIERDHEGSGGPRIPLYNMQWRQRGGSLNDWQHEADHAGI